MTIARRTFALFAAAASIAGLCRAADTLTYADLIARMTRPELLAVLPPAGETSAQCSSYDRASKYDSATGAYVAWDANGDGDGIIRREGDDVVMAEMQGPGCIFRIWSALSAQGRVKIYLDGSATPVVNLPFKEYFTGKSAPFDFPALSYHNEAQGSRGENLYFPIPYRKSCKVTAEKDWGAYYHFNYVSFAPGTEVATFTGVLSPEERAALTAVDEFMRKKIGSDPAGQRQGEETTRMPLTLAPGADASVAIDGARAITALKAVMRFENRETEEAALRGLVLKIEFDSLATPAVWCPLGDFFGTAPGINLYRSLLTGMTADGAYAYWYMPFAKRAKVTVVNEGAAARALELRVTHAPLGRPFEGLAHFHAKWHRDIFPLPKDRSPDWTIMRASGRGRFAGVMLHVWNPRGGWWGEGDEKFFVDGEKFPSTIGTGSEDYFGYAWCHPGLFQHPYHCQTMTQNNKGHQSVLRWHVGDAIPFQKSFEACIEKYYPNSRGTLYACVACFYLSPDGVDPMAPTPAAERHGYAIPLPPGGAGFEVLGTCKGNVEEQDMSGYGVGKWHGDRQLWWTGAGPGDELNLSLKVAQTGTYRVTAELTKAVDYGIVKFCIDARDAGEAVDLYNNGVVPSGPVPLGTHRLEKGAHTLTIKIVGANEKAVKGYMCGLSRIALEAVK
jgi:hypothetical protein